MTDFVQTIAREGCRVKLRKLVLTSLLAAALARSAVAQFQPGVDPYAQPQPPNQGFRFGPDAPPSAPMQPPPPPQYPPQFGPQPPPGPAPIAPPPGYQPPGFQPPGPPQFVPPQFVPPQFVPPQPPPMAPPGPGQPAPPQPAPAPQRPSGRAPLIPGFDPNEAPAANPGPPGALFQPSQIIATVGNQYVLYGDVSPTVEQMIQPALAKASPAEREQIESYRPRLIQQVTRQAVEQKILYLDFEREMEAKAGRDKMADIRKDIGKKMRVSFETELLKTREKVLKATSPDELQDIAKRDATLARLAILMKENQIETLADLDTLLRRFGSSLEKQQRAYLEINLGRMGVGDKLKTKQEVSHLEMITYYREHSEDFAVKARARFEILTVKFANFPNKEAAWRQMAAMGNDVFLGTPFAAVAKKGSQEPNAEKGGVYDWTNENSLASEVINNAIFTMESGKLSPILEDDKGFHIVRVLEREPAGYIPFTDAQVKIKELINRQRHDAAVKAHLEKIRAKTVVWTIYDDEAAANVAQRPDGNQQR